MIEGERNRQIVLQARPVGRLDEACFASRTVDVPSPMNGEILVRNEFVSVDPYMRGHMVGVYDHIAPQNLHEPIFAGAVGRVVESRAAGFQAGDMVEGYFGWQHYAVVESANARPVKIGSHPSSIALGVLGMTGMTAYFGLLDVGKPSAGETVVVSGAAGAVGSLVGQIARVMGCRTIGIAGSDEKVEYLRSELGYDQAINYRAVSDLHDALRRACPDRIDLYFDNVGGPTFDAVTRWMNIGCRYVVCGQIAQYEETGLDSGPRNLKHFETKRARLEGFRVLDYRPRYNEAIDRITGWLDDGTLTFRETVFEGLESAPRALQSLFEGGNIGKTVVRVI